ncbi:hypothetical protein THAOC_35379 [Thalassiosira oceanica]|uniref:Uncharacterized protein n=1 Tax=Thalassiosira oceanica TaxID=159749 RepID=K0R3H0_THAOC|nr:hypothetical protein THAOC_35379 [Thalassiosira oceanica]|eukprot:EJK45979.1 hypothetical protein THAOC_35379 [Thalassiosira oceanica]
MRANPSSKALAVLLAVLASAVSSARAKQLRATAADEIDYGDKKNKGDKDKGDVIDSNDEPGRRQPGPSYGRAIKDLFGSVPVQVETSPAGGEGEARLLVRADDAAPRVCQVSAASADVALRLCVFPSIRFSLTMPYHNSTLHPDGKVAPGRNLHLLEVRPRLEGRLPLRHQQAGHGPPQPGRRHRDGRVHERVEVQQEMRKGTRPQVYRVRRELRLPGGDAHARLRVHRGPAVLAAEPVHEPAEDDVGGVRLAVRRVSQDKSAAVRARR